MQFFLNNIYLLLESKSLTITGNKMQSYCKVKWVLHRCYQHDIVTALRIKLIFLIKGYKTRRYKHVTKLYSVPFHDTINTYQISLIWSVRFPLSFYSDCIIQTCSVVTAVPPSVCSPTI